MKIKFNPRRIFQVIFLGLVVWLALAHQWFGVEKAASVDAFCPFGAVENFFTYLSSGVFIQRIYWSNFILAVLVIIITVILGRVFCSFICPLGAIQEWIRGLGRLVGIKKDLELPGQADKYLRLTKYLILVAVIIFSYRLGALAFRDYDPYVALMHFGQEFDELMWAYIILGIFLAAALFSKNWWCRYFCPLGAFLAIFKKIGIFKITREESSCITCGLCSSNCPANLPVLTQKETKSADCVSCLNCVNDCPSSSLSASLHKYVISKKFLIWILPLSFAVPLLLISFTPLWKTMPENNLIDSQGKANVSNIRGSNSLRYVSETFDVPLVYLVTVLGLPENIAPETMIKTIVHEMDIKNKDGEALEVEDFQSTVGSYLEKNGRSEKE